MAIFTYLVFNRYSNYLFKIDYASMVLGKYDFKYHKCFAGEERPDRDDELTLLYNNKYRSSFFGNGEYHVEYGVFDTRLVLSYSGGTASCELVIKKRGNSVIIVVDDTCDFFIKRQIKSKSCSSSYH